MYHYFWKNKLKELIYYKRKILYNFVYIYDKCLSDQILFFQN